MSEPSKELLLSPETKATECFLIKEDSVLLGFKKRGFGAGKLLGPGGKVNEGESSEECVVRETEEEIGVEIKSMRRVGSINFFYFEAGKATSQNVDFYLVDEWDGEPRETDEMKPTWYKKNQIPLGQMPASNSLFIPHLLNGVFVSGSLIFDEEMKLVSNQLVISDK